MPFLIGETVGPYRLLEQLGQGGMATVFKAYHPALDRHVAIKALHPAFTQEPNFLARFKREAQVVAHLEHSNIVPIYDFSEHEGRPYLVMKYIEGETLKARMKQGKLDEEVISHIVESVGSALEYAHQQGILHRDVKPSNVLLSEDGRIYLSDFGLARMAQAGESTLSSDIIIGTPQYISPEQAMGESELDNGTDIYSLGILLYEMTVGKVPFSADTPYSIIHDHIYTPLPLPHLQNEDIPLPVERVILKALAKERADRFETVGEMVASWQEAIAQSPPASQPSFAVADGVPTVVGSISPPGEAASAELKTPADQALDGLIPVQDDLTTPTVKKRKTRRWWIYLIGALFLVCLCFFALAVLSSMQGNRRSANASRTALIQGISTTSQPAVVQDFPKSDRQTPPGRTPLPASTDSEAIREALRTLTSAPEDPIAHFNLALAYLDAAQLARAQDEFNLGKRYADESYSFFVDAGDYFFDNGKWLMAAMMFNLAVEYSPIEKPRELIDNLHSSLYLAAADPRMMIYAQDYELIQNVDPYMQAVVSARHFLHQGEPERAKESLEKIPERNRSRYEVRLVEAEILLHTGDSEAAAEKLHNLGDDAQAPTWVRYLAGLLLERIPE